MADRPPFSMLRACFWLLAVVIIIELLMTIFAGFGCFYLNDTTIRQIGACIPVAQVIREQWAEVLAAILALLLAAKNNNPPPPEDKE